MRTYNKNSIIYWTTIVNAVFAVVIYTIHYHAEKGRDAAILEKETESGWLDCMSYLDRYSAKPILPEPEAVEEVKVAKLQKVDPVMGSMDFVLLPFKYNNVSSAKYKPTLSLLRSWRARGAALALSPTFEFVVRIRSKNQRLHSVEYIMAVDASCAVYDIYLDGEKLNSSCIPVSEEARRALQLLFSEL